MLGNHVPATALVAKGPLNTWMGPVQSPFGFHIVQVQSRLASGPPDFATVRAQVRDDYVADARKAANEAQLKTLRRRYRVKVAGLEQ